MTTLALSSESVFELVKSLLIDELKTLRKTSGSPRDSQTWQPSTFVSAAPEGVDPIATDSFEWIALATRVAGFFQLSRSGLDDYLLRQPTLGGWCELILESRAQGCRDLTFSTSGSTGDPKPCAHQWHDLVNEVAFFSVLLAREGERPGRLVAPTPCHHIYGCLFGVLMAERLSLPVIRGEAALALMIGGRLQSGDLVIGIPHLWRQLARQGIALPPGVSGVSSTAPSDPAVLARLREQGLARMIEIYGSSETAGVGWREDTRGAFELLPRWERSQDENYLLDVEHQRQVALMDDLQWVDERRFYPQGRRDHAVQVGGVNVYPSVIARQLETLPEVAQAEVRLMSPVEGDRLKAFIVPSDPTALASPLAEHLRHWCEQHLSPPERPRAFSLGTNLPTNGMNKLVDWDL